MKKTPTVFERDWSGDRSKVVNEIHSGCEWVIAGEGTATRKIDGTCCLVRDGRLYKRREVKAGASLPEEFERCSVDDVTGKAIGWVPVTDRPEDEWHREAFARSPAWEAGTYELIGPKVQGNPEGVPHHMLVRHGHGIAGPLYGVPRDFHSMRDWLDGRDIEGLVFHHPDGRMAKIKLRDFGLKRTKREGQ